MNKLNLKEITSLKNLLNTIVDFLNGLKDKEKQKEALIVIREIIKNIK